MKAMDNLLFQGAAPLPKRISFNSPPELALELLEVYYRIHATILKEEFGDEFPPSRERIALFKDVLDKVERTNLFDPTRCQFHQHFTSDFSYLFSNDSLVW